MTQDYSVLTRWFAGELKTVFAASPWYGQGVRESLSAIPENFWHQQHAHQSIARLVGHMIAWRHFAREKLRDNDAYVLEYKSPEEWPDVTLRTPTDLLVELQQSQDSLLAELARIPPEALADNVPSAYEYTKGDLVSGIIQHDIYHLGQINLIAAILKNS